MPSTRKPSFLLSFLTALLTLLVACPSALAASPPPSISRVSGCTDVGNFTTQCTPLTLLTVWGEGFSINSSQQLNVSIAGQWWQQVGSSSVNSQGQSFSVFFSFPSTLPRGVWLNVTVSIPALSVSSAPFPGLQLWDYPNPVLQSISGCDGSGNATYNCRPDSSVLVFSGLSLDALNGPSTVQVTAVGGGPSTGVSLSFNSRYTNNTVNATTIVIVLSSVYQYLIRDVHFNGTVQIYFQYQGNVNTASLLLSIIPLPPPQLSSLSSRGCNNSLTGGSAQVFDCVGSYSILQLFGDYFYAPFSVSVGGQDCYISGQGFTWFNPVFAACLVPLLPAGFYDVNITNAAGSLIVPQAVGMSSAPAISSVLSAQCYPDSSSSVTMPKLKCSGGELVSLSGLNFRTDVDSFRVTITNYYNTTQQLDCLSPTLVNSTLITCVLPTPPSSYFSLNSTGYMAGQVLVQVLYDGLQGSNGYSIQLYDSLQSPVFTSLQGDGCSAAAVDPATGLWPTFSGCYASVGALLTVTGARFFPGPSTMNVQTGVSLYCNPVASDPPANSTYVVCRLGGPVSASATLTTPNPFYIVTTQGAGWATSHLFYVRFVVPPQAGGTGSGNGTATAGGSGKELSAGVTAAIVVCSVVGLMALAAVGWWQWRLRTQKGSRGQAGGVTERQSGGGYVDSESYGEPEYSPPSRGVAEVPMASLSGR